MIFRSYGDGSIIQTLPFWNSFIGSIDGVNNIFVASSDLGASKSDFVVLRNGVVQASSSYTFILPNTIETSFVPIPGDRMEFICFGRSGL